MENAQQVWRSAKEAVCKNFKSATITFLIIMLVVNGFQMLFGAENAVLGIIIAPMMLILAARDMTAHPVRNYIRQALTLCVMAAAACISMLVPISAALLIHLAVVFCLVYTYTSDCGDHIYFQYVLSYLLLIFLGPISLQQLPLRLFGMVIGAGCLLLYQYVRGYNKIEAVTRDALLLLLEDTKSRLDSLLLGGEPPPSNAALGKALKAFSMVTKCRQKAVLKLSTASMAAVETVLTLERFNSCLRAPEFAPNREGLMLLRGMLPWIDGIHAFVLGERNELPQMQQAALGGTVSSETERFYQWTAHLRASFLDMLHPDSRWSFCKTGVPLRECLKIAVDFSPMRVAYALRVACLLGAGILMVQNFHLDHGKWLLFTIASVSMPYSDEVGPKARKRFLATLVGGAVSLIVFSLIPSATGKMVAMLASGYLSCYMTDYVRSFSCATFGALGGAMMAMTSTGFMPVGGMVLMRIFYIVAGIAVAIGINCFVYPIDRKKATRHLAQKYMRTTRAISDSYQNGQPDLQLRYHLHLGLYQLEDKLRQNAKALQWDEVHSFLLSCQMDVWQARSASAQPVSIPTE